MSHATKDHPATNKAAGEAKAPVAVAFEAVNFDFAPAQVVDAFRRNLELASQVAGAAFEGIEKARGIQFAAARDAQAKAVEMQKALAQTASPADLWANEQKLLMENMQQAMACWVELLGVVTQTNASIQRILGGEVSAATMSSADTLNKALGSFQAGARGEPDWMAAINAANATSQQIWQNTGKMLESFSWRMPATASGGAERKG